MREFKFRAWNKAEKKMDEVTELCTWRHLVYVSKEPLSWTFSEIELMQYTGLLDYYDKEIYEGDIVAHFQNTVRGLMRQIEKIGDIRHLPDFSCSRQIEVIGNIYENPELLQQMEE